MLLSRFPRPMLAALAACSVALAACGGDDGADAPFDPQGTAQDVEAIETILSSPELSSVFLALGASDQLGAPAARLPLAGLRAKDPRAGVLALAEQLRAAAPATNPALLAAVLPPEVLGVTFTYDAVQGRYVPSALAGAPANGARLLLYAVDPLTYEPALPLQQTGHVDLLDESTASSDVLRVLAVSGTTTLVDYRVAVTAGQAGGSVVVDGYLSNGDERLNFDLRATLAASAITFDYDVTVPSRDLAFSADVTLTSADDVPVIDVDMRLSGPNGTVSIAGDLAEANSVLTVTANGGTFALITYSETGIVVTDADGQPLTAEERDALLYIWNLFDEAFELVDALLRPVSGVGFF